MKLLATALSAVVATTLPAVVVSLMQRVGEAERKRVAEFHDRLMMPIGSVPGDLPPETHAGEARMSPFRIVGISIVLIGVMMLSVTPWVIEGVQRWLTVALGGGLVLIGLMMEWQRRAAPRQKPGPELATKAEA